MVSRKYKTPHNGTTGADDDDDDCPVGLSIRFLFVVERFVSSEDPESTKGLARREGEHQCERKPSKQKRKREERGKRKILK